MSRKLFYTEIGWFSSHPQNMFKMFPHISGLENIAFAKGWYENIAITIKAVPINSYRWLWIIIYHTNNFGKPEKYNQNVVKYWIHYINRKNYNYTRKYWGNHWENGSGVSVSNGYLISIFSTHSFLLSGHIHVYYQNIHVNYQLKILTWYNINLCLW